MESHLAPSSPQSSPALPSSDELKAELLDIPEPPEMPPAVTPPGYDDALAGAVKYVRAKRGGDLTAYQSSSSDFDLAFITPVRESVDTITRESFRFRTYLNCGFIINPVGR